MPLSVSFYVRVFWTGKNKKIFIKNLYLCPSSFEYMYGHFLAGIKMIFTTVRNRNEARKE